MGSDPSQTDDHMTVTVHMQSGTVDGQDATYVQTVMHDGGDASQDMQDQLYAQGQHIYENQNDGNGWVDISSDASAQQILQDAEPNVDVNLQHISKLTVTRSSSGSVYQGNMDLSASPDMESALLDGLSDPSATPAPQQALVNAIMKRSTGTVSYTLSNTQGGTYVTNLKATLHVNIPVSALPPSSDTQDMQKYVSSIDMTETIVLTNGFENVTMTAPSGLPSQASSGNAAAGQGGSAAVAKSGTSSTTPSFFRRFRTEFLDTKRW
ncbi:hypothetical protein [Alicyclobacillus pomorum]|uniref:hypothetical protein n=1 Tax=Alicyclobacillus pomorum TaxID=204470 RepID=UPI000479E853|nr:hypothetical protein [Alicyclobacillus pomorum]